MQLTKLRNIM